MSPALHSALPLIISDLDGCLVNVMDELLDFLWREFKVALTPQDCHCYNIAEAFAPHFKGKLPIMAMNLPIGSAQLVLSTLLSEQVWSQPWPYHDAKPHWDVHQLFRTLLDAGGQVDFMTARPSSNDVAETTCQWLHNWGYADSEVKFAKDYRGGKLGIVEDALETLISFSPVGPAVLSRPLWVLEDDPAVAEKIALELGKHVDVFMPDRPWTQKYWKLTSGAVKRRYIEQELQEILG